MTKYQIKYFLTAVITCLTLIPAEGQVSSSNGDATITKYFRNTELNQDSLFLFFYNETGTYDIELNAEGSATSNYTWSLFNEDSLKFFPVNTATGSPSFHLDTLSATDKGVLLTVDSDSFYCWVFKNTYDIGITKASDDSSVSRISCDYFLVNVYELNNPFDYYNPTTFTPERYSMRPHITWTANTDVEEFPEPNKVGTQQIDLFPMEDTYFFMSATDTTGRTYEDKVFVEAIRPKAKLVERLIPLNDTIYKGKDDWYYEDSSRYAGDTSAAPITIQLGHKSENTDSLKFTIYNDTDGSDSFSELDSVLHVIDTVITENQYVYYQFDYPGTYGVELTSMKFWEKIMDVCYDKSTVDGIQLDESALVSDDASSSTGGSEGEGSSLSLPNVFSIPGGNFHFDDKSITNIEIVIYNRYGKHVHKYEGDIRNWPGWDGRLNESNNYVPTGVYFYVIKRLDLLYDFTYYLPDSEYDGTEFSKAYYGALDAGKGDDGYIDYNKEKGTIAGMVHVFNNE